MKTSLVLIGLAVLGKAISTSSPFNVADVDYSSQALTSRDSQVDSYVVVLKDNVSPDEHLSSGSRLRTGSSRVRRVYRRGALKGYSGTFKASEVDLLRESPEVAYIEKDVILRTVNVQNGATYNLAITSQSEKLRRKAQTTYYYNASNNSVTAYIIDTGIYTAHNQFEGRAIMAQNFVEDEADDDLNGHGTHVAGTVGARDYGVYKSARLAGVKVLGINGTGLLSDVIAGIDWAVGDANGTLSVINLSLGGDFIQSLNDAVQGAVASGLVVAVAAGNQGKDACLTSPSSAPEAISVGAINQGYRRPSFSNYGPCVDVMAPGVEIISTYIGGPNNLALATGTSMASPHIAGIAAYLIDTQKLSTPTDVRSRITSLSQRHLVRGRKGSPNLIGNNGYFSI